MPAVLQQSCCVYPWAQGNDDQMKVGIYARVSTKDKEQNPENQLIRLREYCKSRGWDFVEYVDFASGADSSRPQLNKLMTDMRCYNGIVVLRLDRFGRSVSDLTLKIRQIRDMGLFFEAVDQGLRISGDERDAVSGLMYNVLASVAEFERELISDRVRDGITRARKQGKRLGRRPVAEQRGVSIEQVFALRDSGKSIREISQAVGIGRGSVHRILLSRNPPVENEA